MGSKIKGKKIYREKNNIDNDDSMKEEVSSDNFVDKEEHEDKDFEDVDVVKEEINEELMDKELESDDNMSIALIVLILVICFVVGIAIGYAIYRIAINNSNIMYIVNNLNLWL